MMSQHAVAAKTTVAIFLRHTTQQVSGNRDCGAPARFVAAAIRENLAVVRAFTERTTRLRAVRL